MTNFQIFILTPLLTIGMCYVAWLIYKWVRETFAKKPMIKDEWMAFAFFAGFALFFFNFLWFVPRVVVGDVVKDVLKTQDTNCNRTYTKDGDEITERQCWYFEDVLNGKYSEYTERLDIQSYLGE